MLPVRARWGLAGAAVVALVALAVAAVLLRGGTPRYDPATPEGTAQGYLQAVLDRDHRPTLGYLTPALREGCRREARDAWAPDSARVTLAGVHVDGDDAEVDVVVTEVSGPSPFEPVQDAFTVTLVMTRHGDGWAISEAPWPLWRCEVAP